MSKEVRGALIAAALATLLVPGSARADDEERPKERLGFGLVPSISVGKAWGDLDGRNGTSVAHGGPVIEGGLTGVVILPGDQFGFGLTGLYSWFFMTGNDTASIFDVTAKSLLPTAMMAVGPLFLQARGGVMFASISDGEVEHDATVPRFGAGATFVFVRSRQGGGVALTFDVLHASGNVDLPTHRSRFATTTATVGTSFSFD